jgi:hypothetical protein
MPYLYAIGWTALDKWYLGCRYAPHSDPSDLWVSYFTSSKVVAEYRKLYGDPDHKEILATGTREEILGAEQSYLAEWNLHKDPRWLNQSIGGERFYSTGPLDPAMVERRAKSLRGQKRTDEQRARMSKAAEGRAPYNKGRNITEKHRQALIGIKRKPRPPHSSETRAKLSAARRAREAARRDNPQTD